MADFDWRDTLISQYANSPRILAIIGNFHDSMDVSADMDMFYALVWNVDTAEGWGLDVWGRIVGVTRTLQVSTGFYFGFEEAGGGEAQPFGQGQFYSGTPITENYSLSDDAFRLLILAKALANICDGTIPVINQLLLYLFPGRGNAFVTEGLNASTKFLGFEEAGTTNQEPFNNAPFYSGQLFGHMQMAYTFAFPLTLVEFAILQQSGVLPTPTGVMSTIIVI